MSSVEVLLFADYFDLFVVSLGSQDPLYPSIQGRPALHIIVQDGQWRNKNNYNIIQ